MRLFNWAVHRLRGLSHDVAVTIYWNNESTCALITNEHYLSSLQVSNVFSEMWNSGNKLRRIYFETSVTWPKRPCSCRGIHAVLVYTLLFPLCNAGSVQLFGYINVKKDPILANISKLINSIDGWVNLYMFWLRKSQTLTMRNSPAGKNVSF